MLASVTAARPSCRPVRREVLSTSGVACQNLLDAQQHVVGVGQRRARGHQVIENESAFVHLRQQVAAERAVAEDTTRRSAARSPAPAPADAPARSAARARRRAVTRPMNPVAATWPRASLLRRLCRPAAAQEIMAERGRPGERQRERGQQRRADGNRQRAEERAGHSGDRDQRKKHHDRRDGRPDQRHADFAQRAANRLARGSGRNRDAARCFRPPRWRRRSPGRPPPPVRPASSG